MTTDAKTVGVIGLGLLGGAMARRLLAAGHAVVGWDVDPARRAELASHGGRAAASAAEAASGAYLLLSLPTSDVVDDVLSEIGAQLHVRTAVLDTTTGDPERTEAIGRRVGPRYLDATVLGSSALAEAGDVIVMVGGDRATLDECRDVLTAFAREVFHVGPCGSGARMKLVVNLVLGLNRAVLAEGLAFARAVGLDPSRALDVLRAGAAYSRVMDVKGPKMLSGDFTPQARLAQHLKDVRLILEQGERTGGVLPLSTLHRELLERLVAAGHGDLDNAAIVRAFDG